MIRKFATVYPGHIDLPDMGQGATPANERRYANIITIEDPIEFLHRDNRCHINQREVGTDTGSFAQALPRVLRGPPNIFPESALAYP